MNSGRMIVCDGSNGAGKSTILGVIETVSNFLGLLKSLSCNRDFFCRCGLIDD